MPKALTLTEIETRLSDRNYTMVDKGEFKNTKSKMTFRCESGHEWVAQLTHVVNNHSGCPVCIVENVRKDQFARLAEKGFTLLDEYSTTRSNARFRCSNGHIFTKLINIVLNKEHKCSECNESRLTTEIINNRYAHKHIEMLDNYTDGARSKYRFRCSEGHEWKSRADSATCVICDGTRLSKEEVNERIKHKNVELVGDFVNALTKTEFRCMTCSSEWSTTPASVIHQSSCPSCSTKGFNVSKKAHGYILDFGHFIKFGISTNVERRLTKHRSHNPAHKVIYTKEFVSGKDARRWENSVKKTFGCKFVTKDECPDGWTETLCSKKIDELISFTMGY